MVKPFVQLVSHQGEVGHCFTIAVYRDARRRYAIVIYNKYIARLNRMNKNTNLYDSLGRDSLSLSIIAVIVELTYAII